MAAVRKKDIWICSAWQDRKKVTVHTCVSSNEKGAVALRCGSFVFLSNTKRRASKSPAFVV